MPSFARAIPLLILAAGCGSSNTPEIHSRPNYDPEAITTAAFAEYDRDKNGSLEGAELDACPALKGALVGIDTNNDKKISTGELKVRIESYVSANAGTIGATVTVTLDGAPLSDATVTFVPETFLGGAIKEASCKTGPDGTASTFTSGGAQYAGLQPGLYKVKVTREGGAPLPTRFNDKTTLGAEVFGGRGSPSLSFALTNR